MVRRMRADRERQSMAIHNRHDFHAFPALRCSNFRPATLGHDERRIDEAFFFIQRAFVAKIIGNVRQNPTQSARDLSGAPRRWRARALGRTSFRSAASEGMNFGPMSADPNFHQKRDS